MVRSIRNPPSRFQETHVEWEDAPRATLQVYEDDSRTILSSNDSADIPFRWSVNPYRGCFHACAYCYARPSHEYLGFGAGTDFERKIVAKPRAAELLEEAFRKPSWKGSFVCFSGNTDCYQPLEKNLGLTRACLEVCRRYRNPVGIITKSTLILRDVDLLQSVHREAQATVIVSIPFLDPDLARAIEPNAPPPGRRLAVVRELVEAGIPVGVSLGPMIPGLNDVEIPALLQAAREAGATFCWMMPVRLQGPVAQVFEERLRTVLPERADAVMNRIRRMRGGEISEGRIGHRMRGLGQEWAATEKLFQVWHDRLGYGPPPASPSPSPFRIPGQGAQVSMFMSRS